MPWVALAATAVSLGAGFAEAAARQEESTAQQTATTTTTAPANTPGALHWALSSLLLLLLLGGLFRVAQVLRRGIASSMPPRSVPEGLRRVQCGACGTVQYAASDGRIFICCECHSANRLPLQDMVARHSSGLVLHVPPGPVRLFEFKREGDNFFQETSRVEMPEGEQATEDQPAPGEENPALAENSAETNDADAVDADASNAESRPPSGAPAEAAEPQPPSSSAPGPLASALVAFSRTSSRSEESSAARPAAHADPGPDCTRGTAEADALVPSDKPVVIGRPSETMSTCSSRLGELGLPACVICLDAASNVVLLPCAHGGVCEECATRIAQARASGGAHCPHCRANIETLVKITAVDGINVKGVELKIPIARR